MSIFIAFIISVGIAILILLITGKTNRDEDSISKDYDKELDL